MSYYQNSYSAGDTFIDYNGNKYTVVTGGNTPSTPFDSSNIVNDKIVWGDLELEHIVEGGGQGLVDYEANKQYKVGDIVIYDNNIYKCITAYTSGSTFDSTKWEEISANDTVKQVLWQGKSYTAGDVLNLTDIYTNYDCIICYFVYSETGWEKDNIISSIIIDPSKDYIVDVSFQENTSSLIRHYSMSFSGSTATLDVVDNLSSDYYVGRIEGIKIGNAFKVNSATKVNLLPASITVTETEQTVTLLDDITNYDIIYVNWHAHFSDGGNRCHILTITKEEYEYGISSSISSRSIFIDSYQVTSASTSYHRILMFPYSGTFTVSTSGNGSQAQSIIIDSIIGVSFNCPNNYSTDEQLIGTWIDGKPLYQKTFTGITPNTINAEVILATISGMETMVSIDGWVKDSSSSFVPVNFTNIKNVSNQDYIYIYINSTGDICFQTGNSAYANKDFAITIKYTKV